MSVLTAFLGTQVFAGEITFTEWDGRAYKSILHVTYFDTAGSTAICTAFFNDKTVGVGSGYLNSGLARISISLPKTLRENDAIKLACRTE